MKMCVYNYENMWSILQQISNMDFFADMFVRIVIAVYLTQGVVSGGR